MHVPEVLTACILQWMIFFHVQITLLLNIVSSRRKSTPRNGHGCCCRWKKKDHAYGFAGGDPLVVVSCRCCRSAAPVGELQMLLVVIAAEELDLSGCEGGGTGQSGAKVQGGVGLRWGATVGAKVRRGGGRRWAEKIQIRKG